MPKRNFYSLITFALAVFLLPACAAKVESQPETAEALPAAELIRQADALFPLREDPTKLRQAIGLLKRARSADEKSYEAAWKLAKFSYFLGKLTTDDKESEQVFGTGITAGRVASRIEPDRPEGHFWLGACYGGEAERFPFTKGIKAIDKIRESMHRVIEIDPKYQGATAFDALATVELKTGTFGGKAEKAVEYLEKGLALNPDNFLSRLNLAEAFLALDRDREAREQLEQIFKIKPAPDMLPEYKEVEGKARKILQTKF